MLGVYQRGEKLHVRVVKDTSAQTIQPILNEVVAKGSIVVTDEWNAYQNILSDIHHIVIQHKDEEYVRGTFHINTIEGFWSLLKRGIVGIHHQVSRKHLHRYCDEFAFRYNKRTLPKVERFNESLRNATCRLTYNELIEKSRNIGSNEFQTEGLGAEKITSTVS